MVSAAKKDCVLYFYLAPLGVPPVFSVASLGESKAETNTCQIKVRDYDLLSLSLSNVEDSKNNHYYFTSTFFHCEDFLK